MCVLPVISAANELDDIRGLYNVCDQTKVTVKGDGVQGPDNATLTATTSLYAEESRLAVVSCVYCFFRSTRDSAHNS